VRQLAPVLFLGFGLVSGCQWRKTRSSDTDAPVKGAKAVVKPEETCDSNGWCAQKLEGADRFERLLSGIWAASATDVWAVGNRWTLAVTQYDEVLAGVKESECLQIKVQSSGIALSAPGCDLVLPSAANQ
jgi:hypothetical protein